jgi:benzylsuccinate CoA-transferase BbsE subunit
LRDYDEIAPFKWRIQATRGAFRNAYLDLSGIIIINNYCGKLFAEMGADVILVERVKGTHLHFESPFIDDIDGLERSLSFTYSNSSKRRVTLSLGTVTGQEPSSQIATSADLIID